MFICLKINELKRMYMVNAFKCTIYKHLKYQFYRVFINILNVHSVNILLNIIIPIKFTYLSLLIFKI